MLRSTDTETWFDPSTSSGTTLRLIQGPPFDKLRDLTLTNRSGCLLYLFLVFLFL